MRTDRFSGRDRTACGAHGSLAGALLCGAASAVQSTATTARLAVTPDSALIDAPFPVVCSFRSVYTAAITFTLPPF